MMRSNTDASHNTNNLISLLMRSQTHTLLQGEQPHDMLRGGASAKWMMRVRDTDEGNVYIFLQFTRHWSLSRYDHMTA